MHRVCPRFPRQPGSEVIVRGFHIVVLRRQLPQNNPSSSSENLSRSSWTRRRSASAARAALLLKRPALHAAACAAAALTNLRFGVFAVSSQQRSRCAILDHERRCVTPRSSDPTVVTPVRGSAGAALWREVESACCAQEHRSSTTTRASPSASEVGPHCNLLAEACSDTCSRRRISRLSTCVSAALRISVICLSRADPSRGLPFGREARTGRPVAPLPYRKCRL